MFLSTFLYFMKIYQESIYNSSKVQKPEVFPVFLSSSLYADSTACSMRLCAMGFKSKDLAVLAFAFGQMRI